MKIYVASKFENTKRVKELYSLLQVAGHEITHDWTGENAEGMTSKRRYDYLRSCAEKDFYGVLRADAIVLINHERGCGMFTELGIALASNKIVIVVDGFHDDKPLNIFFHLAQVKHVDDLEEVLDILRTLEPRS
jgi:hypothetical protein